MQSLTSGLRDAIDQTNAFWLNASALRLAPLQNTSRPKLDRGKRDVDALKVLGSVTAGYNVPFPLSLLYTPTSMELRSAVFGFLCQLDYARRCLAFPATDNNDETWRMKHRLRWFIE